MTRAARLKRETITIIRTMQFAINAMEQVKEGFIAMAETLEDTSYAYRAAGVQEGIDFLVRLKEVKEKQL